MRLVLTAALVGCGLLAAAPAVRAQETNTDRFTWQGAIPDGRWINIKNLNGPITVTAASGDKVQVTGTKHWRRGDPQDVRFTVQQVGSGKQDVLICALWGDRSSCDEDGYNGGGESRRLRNNDVSVDFRIAVPKGVKVSVSTVNGDVRVDGATSEVEASSVNGGVEATSSGGPVNATSVNGSVRASMGRFPLRDDITLNTVNGSVTAEFAGDLNADVQLETVNGRFYTDYQVTVDGRLDPKSLRGRIGKGGPKIKMSTVNGSVELRSRGG